MCSCGGSLTRPRDATQELKLDFYSCIKALNFVRTQARWGCLLTPGAGMLAGEAADKDF